MQSMNLSSITVMVAVVCDHNYYHCHSKHENILSLIYFDWYSFKQDNICSDAKLNHLIKKQTLQEFMIAKQRIL